MAQVAGEKTEFSIQAFRELFAKSKARKYLSRMEEETVRRALEEKNADLLKELYAVLVQEQESDEKLVQEYVMTQNKLMDDYSLKSTAIEKKYLRQINAEKIAPAEKSDQDEAERLLGAINDFNN
jgi:hypothetical protein